MPIPPSTPPDHILDVGETACGELIMLIFAKIKTLAPGQTLEVVSHDPGALQDIPAWCRQTGNPLIWVSEDRPKRFVIQKKES